MGLLTTKRLWSSRSWRRLALLGCALLVGVLLPFVLWSHGLEAMTPSWLQDQDGQAWLAATGITLLITDVLLPVPSSVIAVTLCWHLGPWGGGLAVTVGVFLAFTTGYGLGRLLPESRLRQWIGPALWDSIRHGAREQATWWILLARPLPVLAELTAIVAGVWRLPLRVALAPAALSSAVIGFLYGGSAWLGARAPGFVTPGLVLLSLPALFWSAHRLVLHWLSGAATIQTAVGNHDAMKESNKTKKR